MEPGILIVERRSAHRFLKAVSAVLLLAVLGGRVWGLGFFDPGPPASLASRIADAMTDDELLGQVFFLGYQGVGPSAEIQHWIKDHSIGGVKLFPRNVSDLTSLARDVALMQRLAERGRFHVPLFVATDQEGGWVRQIKDETSISPGNLALGASGVPGDASGAAITARSTRRAPAARIRRSRSGETQSTRSAPWATTCSSSR